LDGVSFAINRKEIFGLVGESGSGKTVCSLSVMKLLDPPGKVVGGHAWFNDVDLLELRETEMRDIRGSRISMIFQDARSCLNPFMKIGKQMSRVFRIHGMKENEAKEKTNEMLLRVKIPDPKEVQGYYPHQLSGGMAQRVMTAIMLSCNPELLIADEPTTGLDVTTQSSIMSLMRDTCSELGTSIWLITHDLALVAQNCDRVAVMHAGHVVEIGSAHSIFKRPSHPYTRGLIGAVPRLDRKIRSPGIPGQVPSFLDPPMGCRFALRCTIARQDCLVNRPNYAQVEPGHVVMCHRFAEG
jgi:oligopeptide/dipeptide ABC transporter ATP-binding protein